MRTDLGRQGVKLARRPEWDKCFEHLRRGDELVITRLSRPFRSVRHMTELAAALDERSIDLIVLKEGIHTATSNATATHATGSSRRITLSAKLLCGSGQLQDSGLVIGQRPTTGLPLEIGDMGNRVALVEHLLRHRSEPFPADR